MAGAHAVGVADGGSSLPILGWSTEGGDLRIPHFIGMHGLQALPLLALALELPARHIGRLRAGEVRGQLMAIGALAYSALVLIVTWQALRGQSIVAPDALTTSVTGVLVGVIVLAVLIALGRAPHRNRSHPDTGYGR